MIHNALPSDPSPDSARARRWCAAGEVAQATGGSYCMSCCVAGVLPFVAPFIWCGDRKRLQEKYGIEPREEDATACLTVFFCACCAIIQVRARGAWHWDGGHHHAMPDTYAKHRRALLSYPPA